MEGLSFLVYIKNFPRVSETLFTVLFADDICISLKNLNCLTPVRKFNEKICKVSEWLNTNRLTLNTGKAVCVNFSTSNIPESDTFIKLNNVNLIYSRTAKYLGEFLDIFLILSSVSI